MRGDGAAGGEAPALGSLLTIGEEGITGRRRGLHGGGRRPGLAACVDERRRVVCGGEERRPAAARGVWRGGAWSVEGRSMECSDSGGADWEICISSQQGDDLISRPIFGYADGYFHWAVGNMFSYISFKK